MFFQPTGVMAEVWWNESGSLHASAALRASSSTAWKLHGPIMTSRSVDTDSLWRRSVRNILPKLRIAWISNLEVCNCCTLKTSKTGHCSDLFWLVLTCSDLFWLVLTCSDLFWLFCPFTWQKYDAHPPRLCLLPIHGACNAGVTGCPGIDRLSRPPNGGCLGIPILATLISCVLLCKPSEKDHQYDWFTLY